MRLIHFDAPSGDLFVVPEQVAWLQRVGAHQTRIGFAGGGEPVLVRGTPEEVGERLQAGG